MKFLSLFNTCIAVSISTIVAAPLPSPFPPHHHIHNTAFSQSLTPNHLSIHEANLPPASRHCQSPSFSSSDPTDNSIHALTTHLHTRRGNSLGSTPANSPPKKAQPWDLRLLDLTNPTWQTRAKYKYYKYAAREYIHGRRPWGDWYLRRQARAIGRDMFIRGTWQERGLVRESPFEKRSDKQEGVKDVVIEAMKKKGVKEEEVKEMERKGSEEGNLKKSVHFRLFGFNIF